MAHTIEEKKKLLHRVRRIMGQVGAIEKALDLKPVLIVTDLSMPVMNGLVATRILRKLMPKVPIILYSAHIDPHVEKEALAAGAENKGPPKISRRPLLSIALVAT